MANIKHGDARNGQVSRLHNIWRGVIKRTSPKGKYFTRGIRLCDEWRDYKTFKFWAMANGYADDLSIERIDNDGDYAPENCRWITMGEQARNRRNTRWMTFDGDTKSLAEWMEITGLSRHLLLKKETIVQ